MRHVSIKMTVFNERRIHLPLCCSFGSKFPILSLHCPEGFSPQLNKVVNFQFVKFLLRETMSTLRLRVSGDMVPLGACNSTYRYPRTAKSRSTFTWTCSKNFISQLPTVKETSDGMALQLKQEVHYSSGNCCSLFQGRANRKASPRKRRARAFNML